MNAHFDPRRALPAADNAANTQADLFETSRITNAGPNKLLGTLLFSMGCHAGLSVEDIAIGSAYADWTQTLAAQRASFLGNTGYGYGDSTVVAYSEELMRLFAEELRTASDAGHALVNAKQRYLATLVVRGVYDEKAASEATFYGLPMYELGPPTALFAAASAVSPAGTEPATGLPSHRVDFQPSLLPSGPAPRLLRVNTTDPDRGSYWAVDGRAMAEHFRPIQPFFETDVTADDTTLVAHGALVTRLESSDQPVDPVFSRPTIDLTEREGELSFGDVAWPSKIQGIGTYEAEGERRQLLTLVPGQFFSDGTVDPAGVGTQRLFTDIGVDVVYSSSTDFVPPELTRVDGAIVGGAAAFTVCADDPVAGGGDVRRVLVLYRDDTPSANDWRRAELVRTPGSCLWTGGGPASGDRVEYLVQALDDAGNVGVSSFKARYYEATPQPAEPPGFDVELTGTAGPSGWFTTPVEVALAATGGSAIEFSLDGGPLRRYEQPFTISTTGVHTIEYASANGIAGTEIVPVDVSDPTIEIVEPAANALYAIGQVVRADFTCADAGAGIESCAGSTAGGALLDTTTPGEHTLQVTATDAAGHVTTATRTYTVGWRFTGFVGLRPPPATTTVHAETPVPLVFQLGGFHGLNVIAPGYPKSQKITCGSSAVATGGDPTRTFAGIGLKFVLGYYVYLWKTERSWRGTCRQFVLKLRDNSTHRVNFKFR